MDLFAGHLFVFLGRRGARCEIPFWDRGGLVLYCGQHVVTAPVPDKVFDKPEFREQLVELATKRPQFALAAERFDADGQVHR